MGAPGAPRRADLRRFRPLILVTVGTQLPFPRLIHHLDGVAPGLGRPILAQIGADPHPPQHMDYCAQMAPSQFDEAFEQAEVVVSHAGIGTLLGARRHRKPLIIVPRRVALGEHRNDHQMATARQLEGLPGVHVAFELETLDVLLGVERLGAASPEGGGRLKGLLTTIQEFTQRP